MASTRKSRTANKRLSKLNEESPHKDGESTKVKTRKKKLSDMLGSQWNKEELDRFYEAYRKYGKDWKKVSGIIRNRSADMVEALYNMNKAYLSLQDGVATAAGLTAMMTDHYNILEGSESDLESNDGARISSKSQKRGRGKFKLKVGKGAAGSYPDLLQHQSSPSNSGCLPLLKKKRSGGFAGSQPHPVGKRTPRFPVSYISDKVNGDMIFQPKQHGSMTENDTDDDEGAHVAALALAEGFQRGGSLQVSRTPGSRMDDKNTERKLNSVHMDEECREGSLGSREAENEDFVRDSSHIYDIESAEIVASKLNARRLKGKRMRTGAESEYDDGREACSSTEEGLNAKSTRDEMDTEFTDEKGSKSSNGQRKRSRKLFFGDESTALDALQTLADLSLNILMPPSAVESESSALVKEDKKNFNAVEKPVMTGKIPKSNQKDKSKSSGNKEKCCQPAVGIDVARRKASKFQKTSMLDSIASLEVKQDNLPISKVQKRKRKILEEKVLTSEAHVESHLDEVQRAEVAAEEGKKFGTKSRRSTQVLTPSKQSKSAKPSDNTPSSTDLGKINIAESASQLSTNNEAHLPTKAKRRKMSLQKLMAWKGLKTSESSGENHPKAMDLKEKLSHCLLSPLLRRWCTFEWFYSAIDYPWFAKSEFVEYLNHVGLGHVPRLTRVEWGVIRSSLGKPRRLSQQFLREEREKLEQYRESVRTHYAELRAGSREGLPTDLARPLSVGQRVIACHPKTREIHDGSVLTVDRNRCRVQFDQPELGVEFVMDIDCMPLNPLENMPDALRKQNLVADSLFGASNEMKPYDRPKDGKADGASTLNSCENMESVDGPVHSSNYPMNTLMKQSKGDSIDAIAEAKAAANEVAIATRQALYSQPFTLAQIQAREDDIRALSELTRALDKKEALLLELRNMNEEVSLKQKESDSLKDFDHFRKQYAMVLLQLRDANNLVASALLYLRHRSTHLGNSTPPQLKPLENSAGMVGPPGSFSESSFNRDSGSHVVEIVESSRRKAKSMVSIAVQAVSSLKEGEDPFAKVGEALDSTKKWAGVDSAMPPVKHFHATDQGHGNKACQNQATSCTLELTAPTDGHDLKPQISDRNASEIPSELISSCVSTFIMIQRCTERQYPPAEVAQILESAVLSLMPCCPQNMPLHRDIEDCMGYIKQQMLALVPSPSTTALPIEHPAG